MTKNTTQCSDVQDRRMASISKLDSLANNIIIHYVKESERPSFLSEVKWNTGTDFLPILGSIIQYTYQNIETISNKDFLLGIQLRIDQEQPASSIQLSMCFHPDVL